MKKLHFVKIQGTGNDFILLNEDDLEEANIKLSKDLIMKMCCRHFGIGSDGVLVVSKGVKAPFKYVMYNPDGTQAEMCGNGVRCYMKYLFDKKIIHDNNALVEIGSGVFKLEIDENMVTVNMGRPSRIKNLIYKSKHLGDRFPLKIENEEFIFTPVSMGNPHAVIYCKDNDVFFEMLEKLNIEKYGRNIENNTEIFPDRTNVEFVKVISDDDIMMRVWERGAGETLSCGTCACAAVVAGILSGKLKKDKFIKVRLSGGFLEVKWSGNEEDPVIMRGEANEVFEGYYYI